MFYTSLKNAVEVLLQNKPSFILFCAAVFFSALLAFLAGRALANLKAKFVLKERLAKTRADAIKRSRAVLGGLAAEQTAPFLPGFPCNPADARFVGKPVDFIAFPGAAQGESIKEVLLIEVKSGGASLSAREKEILECVESGRVRFEVYRIPETETPLNR